MAGRCFIGASGWNYKHWGNGVFYPKELKKSEWFGYYCQHFDTVEINNTFYQLPSQDVFGDWRDQAPKGFTFALKASRFTTHIKKLKQPEQSVVNFLQNAKALGEKLGVILFQLPGGWQFNAERLEAFLEFVRGQEIIPNVRAALEIRNESWHCSECHEILKRCNVALALTDWPKLPVESPVTADFVFMRRHGPEALYASSYSEAQLKKEAERIRKWTAQGKDVFVYFNNDGEGYAVQNALRLRELAEKKRA